MSPRILVWRALRWFIRPTRPDLPASSFLAGETIHAMKIAPPERATSPTASPPRVASRIMACPSPPSTLAALIDAYAAPTPASDKRGEYPAARRMAAIAQLRAELDQHERALRAMALGSPDLGLSRMVGAIRDVQQAIAGMRAKIQQLQTEGQGT